MGWFPSPPNPGPLNVNYNSAGNVAGLSLTNGGTFNLQSGPPNNFIILGDSMTEYSLGIAPINGNTVTATVGSTLVTVNYNSHELGPAMQTTLTGCNQVEFNCCSSVVSIIDANNFTMNLNFPATVVNPTGAGITLGRGNTSGTMGYLMWGLQSLRLQLLKNAGLAGDYCVANASANMPGVFARLPYDVFPYNPQLVILWIGINDIGSGQYTATQIATNIIAIINALLARNINVVVLTLPPTNSGWGPYSAANSKVTVEVNRQVSAFVNITQGVVEFDLWGTLVDPTSALGIILTSNVQLGNAPHMSAGGAYLAGQALTKVIQSAFNVPLRQLVSSNLDCYANDTSSLNTTANPLFQGTGGTVSTGTTATCAATLGTLVGGALYTNGTYNNVPMIYNVSGTGTGLVCTIVVSGAAVTSVTIQATAGLGTYPYGSGYAVGDVLTAAAANIGGTGSGFTINVATVSIPGNWEVLTGGGGSQTATVTVVPRTLAANGDTLGNDLVVTFNAVASGDSVTIETVNTYGSQFTNNCYLYALMDLRWANGNSFLEEIEILCKVTCNAVNYQSEWGYPNSAQNMPIASPSLNNYIEIPPVYVPPTGSITSYQTNIVFKFLGACSGFVIKLGRASTPQAATLSQIP